MKLNLLGSKPLYLFRDPQSPLEAATKNYVDNSVSTHASNAALHITTAQNTFLDALTVTAAQVNYLSNISGDINASINSKLSLAGGTMTGRLYLWTAPADPNEATNKAYVDAQDAFKVAKAGDTLTGFLTLHAAPTSAMHAANKQYVDSGLNTHASDATIHVTSAQRTLLNTITASATEINYLVGTTSAVQTQLNSKLPLAGGTLTGALTLAADPATALQAATKQYADNQVATRLPLAGGTLTGALTLAANPSTALQAATKQYADGLVSTHAADAALHMTAGQNTFLDAITVTAAEVNTLAGSSTNIVTALAGKFDKTGGTVNGDITLGGAYGVFVSKVPVAGTELVNKAYVDAAIVGQRWEQPILVADLLSATLSTPPVSPAKDDCYIVSSSPTGAWATLSGRLVAWSGTAWVDLLGRDVAVGDRFGVKFKSATAAGADLTSKAAKIVTLASGNADTATPYTFTEEAVQLSSTTLVFNATSPNFGVTFSYSANNVWVATNTSVNIVDGDGLVLTGNTLNVTVAEGLLIDGSQNVKVNLATDSALTFSTGKIQMLLDGTTLTKSASGLKISDASNAKIEDAVLRSGANTVSGSITVSGAGAFLRVANAPAVATDVTTKSYVDGAIGTVTTAVNTVSSDVATLKADPTTKTYVDAQAALKVAKAGDTLTGFLTLHAAPASSMQAANKGYVDTVLTTHAGDAALHLTSAQNTLIDAITASAAEINYNVGVTSGVQAQLNSKLGLAGGTMTGDITLASTPVGSMGAVNKGYVDTQDALKVAKAGDTLTGFLTLHAAPTAALHASSKGYVDSAVSTHAADATLHITAAQNTLIDGITATAAEINYNVGVTSAVQTQLNAKLALAGGTMTGALTLAADPAAALQAATKQYADNQDALRLAKTGGTMTGDLVLVAGVPPTANSAANKQYVLDQVSGAQTTLTTAVNAKVAKAGDTMTGPLVLSGAPTLALHATTKTYVDDAISAVSGGASTALATTQAQVTTLRGDVDGLLVDPVTKSYVDTQDAARLSRSGGSMTGYITLHADPVSAMQPTTKQYVDSVAQGLTAKPSVRLATTVNLAATYDNGSFGVNATLTGTANGALVVDGATPLVGDRILVRVQTAALQNGDYTVQQVGNASTPFILKRLATADQSAEIPGSYFYVYDGATLKGTGWVLAVAAPVTFAIGTDAISVNQFSGQGSLIAGDGLTISGATIQVNTASPTRIVVNADTIDLATTAVTPGTYKQVTVDGYGRVTAATNPNTLAGYGIADGQPLNSKLTNLSSASTRGLLVIDSADQVAVRKISVSGLGLTINDDGSGASTGNISITSTATSSSVANSTVARDGSGNFAANVITASLTGNASTATTLATARNFSITGDVTAPAVSFNGSAVVALATTLSTTGVAAGDYTKVTVDTKGRVTAATNPTTVAGYGITDAATITALNAKVAELEDKIMALHSYVMSRI